MYKIYFEGKVFASILGIENACALALSVHRSSNEPHIVRLTCPETKEVILTLVLKDKEHPKSTVDQSSVPNGSL